MNAVVRIIWFFFIGWWLGFLWFFLSLLLCFTIIFLPIGVYSLTKTWNVMTLSTSPKEIIVNIENKIVHEKTEKK